MSRGNFSQFGAGEIQYSDVESVQAPVEDNSAAIKVKALAQGIGDLGVAGIGIYSGIKEDQRKKSLLEQQGMFEKSLLKAAQLADSHGANSLMFRTYLTQEYANSSLDPDTKSKMLRDFQATVLGKPFLEEDPVEKAEKELDEAATKAGFITSNMDQFQTQEGRMQYRAMLSKQEADAEELRLLQLEKTKADLTSSQMSLVDKKIKAKSYESVANLAANYRPVIKNKLVGIVESFQSGRITRQEAEQAIKAEKGNISAVVGQLSRGLSKAEVEPLAQPMYDLYDVVLHNLDSTNALKELNNANDIMVARVAQNQLLNNPELVNAVAFSSLTRHNSPTAIATLGQLSTKILQVNGSKDTDDPANVVSEEAEVGDYLNLVKAGIGNLGRLSPLGDPMVDSAELGTHVDNILKGTANYMRGMDKPKKIKTVVQFLADPQVGKYVKENLNTLSQEARSNISDTLIQNATNYVYPKMSELISSEFMKGGKRQVKHSDVDVSVSSGRVVFKATNNDSWTMGVAQKMNREVGAAMTSYFNAIANVSGESVEEVFERELPTFWPEKAPVDQAPSAPQQTPTQDLSQYEGKVGYKDGVAYTVINGVLTKIGGGANAGSK